MTRTPTLRPACRTGGPGALIRPDSASVQISAHLPTTSVPAARLEEASAALDAFLQTGGSTESMPIRIHPTASRRLTFSVPPPFRTGGRCAHWPKPLTAQGAAHACPTGLPSQSNQRISADPLDRVRPFDPSSRLPSVGLRGDQIGGDDSPSSRGKQPSATIALLFGGLPCFGRLNVSSTSEIAASSALWGTPPLLKAIEQSDFPGGNHRRVFARRKRFILRGSGPLRNASASQMFNVIK